MRWELLRTVNDTSRVLDTFKWDGDQVFEDINTWYPTIDVKDGEKAITIEVEMPGMAEKDINVTIDKSILTISGEKKEEHDEKDEKKNLLLSERSYGHFSRSIQFPEGVKADEVKAEFKNGVLHIELPKDEVQQPRKIEIKVH